MLLKLLIQVSVPPFVHGLFEGSKCVVAGGNGDVKEEIIGRETINGANRLPAIQTNPNTIRKMNFKSLLESIAEKEGLLFMPWNGGKKHSSGKTIYCFGDVCRIYMDNGVAFLKGDSSEWEPVSLDELVQKARRSDDNNSNGSRTTNDVEKKDRDQHQQNMDIDDLD